MKPLLKIFIVLLLVAMSFGLWGIVTIEGMAEEDRPWAEPLAINDVVDGVLNRRVESLGEEGAELEDANE